MSLKESLEKKAKGTLIKTGLELLEKNPEKNVDKLFALVKKSVKDDFSKERVDKVYQYYNDMPAVHDFIQDILVNTNKNCMKKFFANFIGNATWYGISKRAKVGEENDTKIPFSLLISPSMRCNLRCKGCYASTYSKKDDITFEETDRIIKEARDMGIYYIVVLGGETFFNDYMLDIYEKYDDMMFMPFTNGTLIDEKMADKLAELGNVMPMLSVEGTKEDTDWRRGEGVYDIVMKAMDLLKKRGIPFGASTATTRYNVEHVVSDEFTDMLVEKGARMIWYFIFMPVGSDPVKDMDMMLTPEQRIYLGRRTRKIRTTKKLFTIDFFNDAPFVGGCIAGKYYCHINSKEDLEPCIFSHFSTDNIKGKPLIEAFKAPFFKEIRSRQPYNHNLLRPCMMIDNPEQMREIVEKTGARPSDKGAEMMIHDEEFKNRLDKLAEEFAPVADKAYEDDFHGQGNYKMSRG
jgi:MoaA/NifB/PqqE/SkfB family radical SAM enzyme